MEEIVQTEQLEKPPPPPRPPIPVAVPDDVVLTDDEFDFDSHPLSATGAAANAARCARNDRRDGLFRPWIKSV